MPNDKVSAYIETVDRMEPDIAPVDAAAFYASASISLRRIADTLGKTVYPPAYLNEAFHALVYLQKFGEAERLVLETSTMTPEQAHSYIENWRAR